MTRYNVPLLAILATFVLVVSGCSKKPKESSTQTAAAGGTKATMTTMGPGDCPMNADCPMKGDCPMHGSIDCPLRSMGAGAGHRGPGHMGHHHGDKHRPFGSVKTYIAHLDRKDRDTWQKPDAVIQKLGLKPDAVVADVGAGSGYFALRLASQLPKGRVLAIDVEPKMLTHIQQRAKELKLTNLTTVQATASDPKVDPKADLVLVADVLHHVPNQPAWLGRLFQAMKPGARLAIIEFKEGNLPKGPPAHIKIPRDKLLKLLTTAGFVKPVVDDKLLPYQLLVVLEKPAK